MCETAESRQNDEYPYKMSHCATILTLWLDCQRRGCYTVNSRTTPHHVAMDWEDGMHAYYKNIKCKQPVPALVVMVMMETKHWPTGYASLSVFNCLLPNVLLVAGKTGASAPDKLSI